jgi:hypothetical protein
VASLIQVGTAAAAWRLGIASHRTHSGFWQRGIKVKGRQAADEVGQKPTRSCGCLWCVLRLKLAASDEPLRMHRDAVADDHVGQRHRTGKALLGEQSLRRDATARPT